MISETDFNIFPNPAVSDLNMELNLSREGRLMYNIYDMSGKLMKQNTMTLSNGNQLINIDVNDLNEGNYILQLSFENEKPITQKFSIVK